MIGALGVLRRYARVARRRAEPERCEVCAELIAEHHGHIVDLSSRRLLCACNACGVLFGDSGSARLRAVPTRVRRDASSPITSRELDALGVPVGLAFFFRPSTLGRWMAVFPSPGGATEAELPDGAFAALEGRPLVQSIEDDVEALLVRRDRDGHCASFAVPIDVCYELTALLRRHWKGIDGGDEARRVLDEFFVQLAARSEPLPPRLDVAPPRDVALHARFERAAKIADAVLLEGYVLYPYRADATKNRYRWTFGGLAPRSWSEAGGCETWWLEAQVVVASARPRLGGRLRFLRVVDRRIEVSEGDGFRAVDGLEVGAQLWVPWEEGEIREIDFIVATDLGLDDVVVPFHLPAAESIEPLEDSSGRCVGRVVRTRAAIHGAIHVHVDALPETSSDAPSRSRVSVRVENLTPYPSEGARADVMRASCVSTHLLLASEEGAFVSMTDPPADAVEAIASCVNVGTYPVLVGEANTFDLMLCSPIILYDHPQIAPESPGDFFDATEMDEMLALRTKTLTPEEKARARATDPRAAALVDRVDAMTDDALARLHGAIRDPEPPRAGRFSRGQRVRLRPGTRRTDAQDLLYAGHLATIEDIIEDVDGKEYLAVTIDDDPAADLHRWYGRFHHYYPDEVEPV